jgi:ADP-ribose pyrophosphatase
MSDYPAESPIENSGAYSDKKIELGRDDVDIVKEETVYQGFFKLSKFTLRHRLFGGGWSNIFTRELFRRRDAVGVLLYDAQLDCVALIEQFRVGAFSRAGTQPWLLEIVAGIIDTDESPADVAKREALEEANCTVTALEPIAEYISSPGGSDEYFYVFCGRCDLSSAGGVFGLPDENEDIRVKVLPVDDLFARLQRRELNNGLTLVAAQWLQIHHQRMRALWL